MIKKKNLGTCHVVVHCSGTRNPKCYIDLLLFHLTHGLTRSQKAPIIPKKRPKISTHKMYLTFLKVSPETKSFLILLAKNEEKPEKNITLFFRSKTVSPFLKEKKLNKF